MLESDQNLLLAYHAGDVAAFERLFTRHERSVLGYLMRRQDDAAALRRALAAATAALVLATVMIRPQPQPAAEAAVAVSAPFADSVASSPWRPDDLDREICEDFNRGRPRLQTPRPPLLNQTKAPRARAHRLRLSLQSTI